MSHKRALQLLWHGAGGTRRSAQHKRTGAEHIDRNVRFWLARVLAPESFVVYYTICIVFCNNNMFYTLTSNGFGAIGGMAERLQAELLAVPALEQVVRRLSIALLL